MNVHKQSAPTITFSWIIQTPHASAVLTGNLNVVTRNESVLTSDGERGVLTDRLTDRVACDAPIHTLVVFFLASHNPTI